MSRDIRELAARWIEIDNTPENAQQIRERLAKQDDAWLSEHFATRLKFGTAGLRGEMGPGPNRMNRGIVQQTSLGIARYLAEQNLENPSVVIGFDARKNSRDFALQAANTFTANGVDVHFLEELCATPFLAYAVVALSCSAGVMITASHNPPSDNGYKVYWNNGAQIIPPQDTGISSCIEQISDLEVWKQTATVAHRRDIQTISTDLIERYHDAVQHLRIHHDVGANIVYTPLHGVGSFWVTEALRRAGHHFSVVPEQQNPDERFPTVQFPNPEEPGAMDLAIDLATKIRADIVVANDPDADRMAIAIPDAKGTFTKLTGDQVGLLLSDYLLKYGEWGSTPLVATTIVSSSQLADLAAEYKCKYTETLTGFKWIANEAIRHDQQQQGRFVIGFEEALGYSIGQVARDKDGVSAIVLAADLITQAQKQGKTLWDLLIDIYERHGLALSTQKSIKKPGSRGAAEITEIMNNLRRSPPSNIAGSKVLRIRDYLTQRSTAAAEEAPLDLPKSNVLAYDLEDGGRVIVRPSGTEPKIKFYIEAKLPLDDANDFGKVHEKVQNRLRDLTEGILEIVA